MAQQADLEIHRHEFEFASTIDGTGPLKGDVTFSPSKPAQPVILVLQGFSGERSPVRPDAERLARKGLFAVTIDSRGRGRSAGLRDCGGLEIADLVDGLYHAISLFPAQADASNINAIGYSGGGGNALSIVTKFPDLLRIAVSFFGISDYALWYQSNGRPDCNELMRADIGGSPNEFPDRYKARSSLLAARNAICSEVHLFWDEEESMCPPELNTLFKAACDTSGCRNVHVHESHRGDAFRWYHGYTTDWPELVQAESCFLPRILFGLVTPPTLPLQGRLAVPGFLITRHFEVWVGDGLNGVAEIEYDLAATRPVLRVLSHTPGQTVTLRVLND